MSSSFKDEAKMDGTGAAAADHVEAAERDDVEHGADEGGPAREEEREEEE